MKTVFLLPSYMSDSVSFISYQYVACLRARGYDVSIASIRRSRLNNCSMLYVSKWNIFTCKVLVTNLFLPDLFGFIISKFFPSIKWVVFLHCDIIGGLAAERKPFVKLKAWLWRLVLSKANLVISPSLYAFKSLPSINNRVIIPHCIDPAVEIFFRSNCGLIARKFQISKNNLAINKSSSYVFIGRDTPAKRLSSLLTLLHIDKACTIKVIGLIKHSKEKINKLTETEISRCIFLGYQNDPYQFLSIGDVVVCPSGREGFGMIPLECIARNIPVAVINEGVFKELYGGSSISYERIADLPRSIFRLNEDMKNLKIKYIGVDALNERTDMIISALFGGVAVNPTQSNNVLG